MPLRTNLAVRYRDWWRKKNIYTAGISVHIKFSLDAIKFVSFSDRGAHKGERERTASKIVVTWLEDDRDTTRVSCCRSAKIVREFAIAIKFKKSILVRRARMSEHLRDRSYAASAYRDFSVANN